MDGQKEDYLTRNNTVSLYSGVYNNSCNSTTEKIGINTSL